MKLSSFRLRIALLSALLAGSAVTGFSGIAYVFVYQSKLQILDREIQDQLLGEASTPKANNHWAKFSESRSFFFGNSPDVAAILFVVGNDGTTIYQSETWQADLNPNPLFLPQAKIPEEFQYSPNNFPNFSQQDPNSRPNDLSQRSFLRIPGDRPPLRDLTKISHPITRRTDTGLWRMGTASSPFVRMAIAVNLQVINREMAVIRNVFFLLIPVTLLLVMIGAWWLSNDALKSIQNITEIIRRVTAKGLNQRAATVGLDVEFIELIKVFNQMMERLERSFQQASRFSADAAHELKTPLAILQGELERAVQETEAGSKQQQIFSNLLDEVRRLSAITRKLLLLSLADAGQMRIQKIDVNLSGIINDLAEDIDLIAPELKLELDILPNLKIKGDQDLLTQVLQNLITNAIKYNLPNGWIRLKTIYQKNFLSVQISNASKGISAGDRQRIFDRFHRGDSSHNRKVEGFGLGLSLSREIARAHGGDLQLDQTSVDCTAFTLSLPIKN